MIGEGFFKKFADDSTFVERLVIILECRNQTAWVELQQRFWLVIWVHLDGELAMVRRI
jgi:hypothetical protein